VSLAIDYPILEGLMRDIANKGCFALLLNEKVRLASSMEVVAFKVAFLGAIAGRFIGARTVDAKCWNSLTRGQVGPSNEKW
jgi:hypothetical protein